MSSAIEGGRDETLGRAFHDQLISAYGLATMEQVWLQVTGVMLADDNEAFINAYNQALSNVIASGRPPEGPATIINVDAP